MLEPSPRVDVLGVGISPVNIEIAADRIEQWVKSGTHSYVCVTGVHGVSESQSDSELAEIHNRAGMVVPDGMPMVWCAHKAGAEWVSRVYGPDLMLEMCERAERNGLKFFFYGGAEGTPELLKEKLLEKFPALEVVGTHSPPFRALTDEEDAAIVKQINDSGADLVWVGLSTPKQERWMSAHADVIDATMLGVGAAFDFHAGNISQAPAWMQARGLEWFYRLVKEPRRLWRRYLTNNPLFVLRIMRRPPKLVAVEELRSSHVAEPKVIRS